LSKTRVAPVPIATLRGELPAGLVAVLEKMMAADPDKRYQTPAEVIKALADYAKPTEVAAPAKKPETPAEAPVLDAAQNEPNAFQARCPFCMMRVRIPARALGASLPCPQCGNFFTAVPEDDSRDS